MVMCHSLRGRYGKTDKRDVVALFRIRPVLPPYPLQFVSLLVQPSALMGGQNAFQSFFAEGQSFFSTNLIGETVGRHVVKKRMRRP